MPRKKQAKVARTAVFQEIDLNKIPVETLSDEQVADILRKAVLVLKERANLDTIRICATGMRDNETHYYSTGHGNMYAQVGAVKEWLMELGGPGPEVFDGEMDDEVD
jgi:hypothetical protein